ncbi:MAG: TrmH family RNA methyltransferase [Syntrophothermus sp.]
MQFDHQEKKELLEFLSSFISENKRNKFVEYIRYRTRHLTIVLEDIYQPHNASAVLRTCDCFGIQDIHIIENTNRYQVNPDVALGSSKWLTLKKYNKEGNNTRPCLEQLRSRGYKIVATSPHKKDYTPETLPLDQKVALVFGTELEGLSETALEMADDYVKIPMFGFTESFNISVSAALFLYSLTGRLRNSEINWQLSEDEQLDTLISWTKNVLKKADKVEAQFLSRYRK